MTFSQVCIKRCFDLAISALGLLFLWWLILCAFLLASINTRASGFFMQERIGKNGKLFRVIKIRSMRVNSDKNTVTIRGDARITKLGAFWRKTKIDELPQLINVLFGQMSLIGPRPDVPGFADKLEGNERRILELKPGITGPATLKYRNEEEILQKQKDPVRYNNEVIFPDKVRINLEYLDNWSFKQDIVYLYRTIFS